MVCRMIVTGCMTTWRLITTTDVSASPADSEVDPFAAGFQTFLAPSRARCNPPDGAQMRAAFTHDHSAPSSQSIGPSQHPERVEAGRWQQCPRPIAQEGKHHQSERPERRGYK